LYTYCRSTIVYLLSAKCTHILLLLPIKIFCMQYSTIPLYTYYYPIIIIVYLFSAKCTHILLLLHTKILKLV